MSVPNLLPQEAIYYLIPQFQMQSCGQGNGMIDNVADVTKIILMITNVAKAWLNKYFSQPLFLQSSPQANAYAVKVTCEFSVNFCSINSAIQTIITDIISIYRFPS